MSSPRRLVAAVTLITVVASCSPGTSESTTTSVAAATTTTAPPPTIAPSTSSTTSTTTPPPDATALLVVGDWGSGTLPQGAVAGAMSRYAEDADVTAIVTTGDNFYLDDWEFLMEPFEWVSAAGIPFWVSWGNHDMETDARVEAMSAAFGGAPHWTSHQWGAIDLVILDSNQVDSEEQVEYLAQTLAASDRPTILVFHHPVYSCSAHGPTKSIFWTWLPEFDDEVFLVLNGHEHSYQRFDDAGVTYVVTGGGGRHLRPLEPCPDGSPEPLAGSETFHFVALTQTDEGVAIQAIDVNGETFDEVVVPLP